MFATRSSGPKIIKKTQKTGNWGKITHHSHHELEKSEWILVNFHTKWLALTNRESEPEILKLLNCFELLGLIFRSNCLVEFGSKVANDKYDVYKIFQSELKLTDFLLCCLT